jgi:hypothetical protein
MILRWVITGFDLKGTWGSDREAGITPAFFISYVSYDPGPGNYMFQPNGAFSRPHPDDVISTES